MARRQLKVDPVPPEELVEAPPPEQIDWLNPVLHAAYPDPNEFVNNFFLESDTI